MNIISLIQLLGGIGMFLFGMSLLGDSLEKIAGANLEKTLSKLTDNRFKGLALGLIVTCAIQSSAATSVMVIGFLNAGIMKLVQAVPVIMGANIGTTITAQILRLGDISNTNIWMFLLKPSSFAPICIAVGAAINLISKKDRNKNIASIVIGFGILFVGMTSMESALSPLKDSEKFRSLFGAFRNPVLGILVGMLVTSVLQSSSASVGVLQAISSTGQLTFSTTYSVILGMNIGKCVTVIIASLGTNKKAKRAVCIDVMNNIIGTVVFLTVILIYQSAVGFKFWDDPVNRGSIASFHTFFNLATTIILFPFYEKLIKLSKKLVKDTDESKIDKELRLLDDLFLKTPILAVEQCKSVMKSVCETACENFKLACELHIKYDDKKKALLDENEKFLDKTETVLGEYIAKITRQNIDEESHKITTEMIHSISDYERIGDYCINIASVAEYNLMQKLEFSDECKNELRLLNQAVSDILLLTKEAYGGDRAAISEVEPLEETIDDLVEILKERHVARFQNEQCDTQGGISLIEILTNLERISDHCSNIAVHVTQRLSDDSSFDPHAHLKALHKGSSSVYKESLEKYKNLYIAPLSEN